MKLLVTAPARWRRAWASLVMGFGAGVLIRALSFELAEESLLRAHHADRSSVTLRSSEGPVESPKETARVPGACYPPTWLAMPPRMLEIIVVTTHPGVSERIASPRPLLVAALVTIGVTAVLLPVGAGELGPTRSFLPAMLAIVACFDVLSVYLLVGEFHDHGDRRVLVMSLAYVWSLVTMLGYALAFPGVVSMHPPLAATASMAPWFYIAWHAGFPVLLGVAWAPWRACWTAPTPAPHRLRQANSTIALASLSAILAVVALSLCAHHLPVLIHGLDTSRMTALTAPVAIPLTVLALLSTYRGTRHRTGPERWAVVVVLVCLSDLVLTYAARHRFSVGWYAGRSLTLVSSAVVLLATVGALRRAKAQAQREATIDGLTGLANRRTVHRDLQLLIHLSRRAHTPLSTIMFDIDLFKKVNDQAGHQAGDEVLAAIGRELPGWIRVSDIAARVGGEEFLVVLPNTDPEGARVTAEKIRRGVETMVWDEPDRKITVSLGVGCLDDKEDLAILLRRTDAALYAAKHLGRNRTVLAPPLTAPHPSVVSR